MRTEKLSNISHKAIMLNMRTKHREYPWLMRRIKELRISQKVAAQYCGMNYNYFHKTIWGERPMGVEEAVQIADGLKMSVREVITGQKKEDKIFELENAILKLTSEIKHDRETKSDRNNNKFKN